MVVLGGVAVSYDRGTPVLGHLFHSEPNPSRSNHRRDVHAYCRVLGGVRLLLSEVQGYLTHKKTHPPRTLP